MPASRAQADLTPPTSHPNNIPLDSWLLSPLTLFSYTGSGDIQTNAARAHAMGCSIRRHQSMSHALQAISVRQFSCLWVILRQGKSIAGFVKALEDLTSHTLIRQQYGLAERWQCAQSHRSCPPSVFMPLSLSSSLFLFLYLCYFQSFCLCTHLSICNCLCHRLCFCISVSIFVTFKVSVYALFCLYATVFFFVFVSVSLSLSLLLSKFLSMHPFVYMQLSLSQFLDNGQYSICAPLTFLFNTPTILSGSNLKIILK